MQSRERKRHRLGSLFGVKPKAAASENDTAGSIAGGDSVLATPDAPQPLTEGRLNPSARTRTAGSDEDQQKCFDAHVAPKDGGHEAVLAPAISTEAATKTVGYIKKPVDLWKRAYQDLKIREKALVETFERNITYIANPTADTEQTPFDYGTIQKIAEQKIDARKAGRLSIQLGNYPVEFRAVGEKIIEGLLWSSTFIGAAVSTQPYAALAWSGVSMILPLLLNNSKQDITMIEGLEKITMLMQLFHVREQIYLQDVRRPPWPEFEAAVAKLYSTVFEYDARVITHLSDPTVKRAMFGTFLPNRWDATMASIQDAKQQCEEFGNLFDRSREVEQFASIQETLASLKAFKGQHQQYRQEDQEARLLQALSSDYKGDMKTISDRSDGTCEWFFHDQGFLNWRDSNMTSLLWVSGCPGSGKTVLSKALIDYMITTDNCLSSTVCYFFFKAGQERKERAADALSAILHQLFQNTNLITYGFASYKNHGANLSQMFSDLWEILMKCAKDSEAGRITLVIDALDECEEESRNHFIRELACLCSSESTNQRVGCSLKFIVTSQPCEDIKDQFERLSGNSSYLHIDIDSYSSGLGHDIDLVIDGQVKEFARIFDSEKQKFIADHLKSRDNRTYLWLVLITDIIKKSSIEYSKFLNVQKLLFDLPDKFSHQYNRILSRSRDPELAKKLLEIVAAATRPLTLREANIALTIAMCHQQGMAYKDLELWSSDDFPSIVKDLCGLMVAIHDDKLSLFHPTVRTFLIAKSTADSPIATPQLGIKGSIGNAPAQRDWEGCLDISNAHGLMCRICLNYLTLSNFIIPFRGVLQSSRGRSWELVDGNGENRSLNAFVKDSLKKYAFLDYSALTWPYHYRQQDQQQRSILQVDAELMCNPSCVFFVNWASISFSQERNDFFDGWDGLSIASYLGLADIVEKISLSVDEIDAYQPLYAAFPREITALRIAIKRGFPDVVRVLLKRGADPSLQDQYGGSPLCDALQGNFLIPLSDRIAILQMLFESGLDINSKTAKGLTALIYASLFSSEDIVRFLVEQGADLEAPTGCPNWAYEVESAVFLKDCRVHTNSENTGFGEAGGRALHIAAYNASVNLVDLFIERGADVNAFGGSHGTALIAACSRSWIAIEERLRTVDTLVENGAEIHVQKTYGGNAMQVASYNGEAEIVALLLRKGADVNSCGGIYGTALIAACCSAGKEEKILKTVKLLITNGADIDYLGEHHGSALYQAALYGRHKVVRLLIEAKANVYIWNDPMKAPLVATRLGKENAMETVRLMLDNGADINASEGLAVWMASMLGTKEMVSILVENRSSLKASESGFTALHAAAMYARADIADTLIGFGVDVNSHHSLLGTPLHFACSAKADEVIPADTDEPEMLFDNSDRSIEDTAHLLSIEIDRLLSEPSVADLRKKRAEKRTEKRLAMVRMLVEKKADVNVRRAGGISVLHDALERDDRDVVDFLIANGASLDQEGEASNLEKDRNNRVGTDDE